MAGSWFERCMTQPWHGTFARVCFQSARRFPQFSCHFLRICWSFIDFIRLADIVGAAGGVFYWNFSRRHRLGLTYDFGGWVWLLTREIEHYSQIHKFQPQMMFSEPQNRSEIFMLYLVSTHATQRLHHSFRTSCTMKQAPWQVSLPAREQPRVKRFKAKINSDVPRTMKQWVARTRF